MKKVTLKQSKRILTWIMLVLCVNLCSVSAISLTNTEENVEVDSESHWDDNKNGRSSEYVISISKTPQYLTIQDSNPVNTITVKITSNETGATVFENVYPQGQTSFIVIPMNGWSAGSYTIELFGRENNGYLWGTFQVLP